MKNPNLYRAENILRRMVEEPFSWFARGDLDPFQLAKHLTSQYIEPAAANERPNWFVVRINPSDLVNFEQDVALFEAQVVDYVSLLTERFDCIPTGPLLDHGQGRPNNRTTESSYNRFH
jgi:hypothetical protein